MLARFFSASMPPSAMLESEPTVTYSLVPSGLASRLRAQWLFGALAGRSTTLLPAAVIAVAPAV
jgi:hypothetical protein